MNPIGQFLDRVFPQHQAWESRVFHGLGLMRADDDVTVAYRDLHFQGDPLPPSVLGEAPVETLEPSGDPLPLGRHKLRVSYKEATGDLELLRHNVVYTAAGLAWHKGALDAACSVTTPASLRQLVRGLRGGAPFKVAKTLPQATVIQAHNRKTYGDWVPCFLRRLLLTDKITGPLLLPWDLRNRGYVKADLDALGIEYEFVDAPVRIEECHVLRQPLRHNIRPTGHIWSAEQLATFRAKKPIEVPTPKSGSLVYLSRVGVSSNLQVSLDRNTRSEQVEEVITAMGGRVVRTEGMGFADFGEIANDVETLVCDHGAAMCNLVQWSAKHVIELVPEDWWSWSFVPLAETAGAEEYTILRPGMHNAQDFEARLRAAIAQFAAPV